MATEAETPATTSTEAVDNPQEEEVEEPKQDPSDLVAMTKKTLKLAKAPTGVQTQLAAGETLHWCVSVHYCIVKRKQAFVVLLTPHSICLPILGN